jgi:hypothetical protein
MSVTEPDTGEQDWSGWERWLQGHLAIEREQMLDGIAEAMVTLIERERDAVDRQLAELRAENAEVKGLLADVLRKYDELKTRTVLAQHL